MSRGYKRPSLQDIRTNAGRVTAPGSKQRLYLRLCTLEMERHRREQEFNFASERAEAAKRRVDRLQSEIDEITEQICPARTTPIAEVAAEVTGFVEHRYGAARKSRATKPADPTAPVKKASKGD